MICGSVVNRGQNRDSVTGAILKSLTENSDKGKPYVQ